MTDMAYSEQRIAQINELDRRVKAGEISRAEMRAELGLDPETPAGQAPAPGVPPFLAVRRDQAARAEIAREVLQHTVGLDARSVGQLTDAEAVEYAEQAQAPAPTVDPAEWAANIAATQKGDRIFDARLDTLPVREETDV